ncbi:MarR family transcriptional regulator [Nocardiopsis sp. N85]|uniref:ArsR family transcriptional regulator n=1 Tax=Nocardiopsis sp. N85 TaxID=3029400 RepID=UPI00237FA840|nr:helix-turn-helix domain-containing protein [Nocardiopsis sp. N85]MDE3721457.1 MarR family transcriptional regulator [Nocardiopsis sp. N85]
MTTTTAPARELIMTALTEAGTPLTVTDLAEVAGVGKSTVSKYLPALEKDGAAVRTPGGRDGRRRLPDHWQAAPTTATEQDPASDEDAACAAEDFESAVTMPPVEGGGNEDAQVHPQDSAPMGTGETGLLASGENSVPEDAGSAAEPAAAAALDPASPVPALDAPAPRAEVAPAPVAADLGMDEPTVNPVSGSRRLASGELKLMVWALLKAAPEQEYTATELSHLLQGRSIGAIQNNLAKLTKEGKTELTCDKPRRYRFAA